jgi:hypothetical protein
MINPRRCTVRPPEGSPVCLHGEPADHPQAMMAVKRLHRPALP